MFGFYKITNQIIDDVEAVGEKTDVNINTNETHNPIFAYTQSELNIVYGSLNNGNKQNNQNVSNNQTILSQLNIGDMISNYCTNFANNNSGLIKYYNEFNLTWTIIMMYFCCNVFIKKYILLYVQCVFFIIFIPFQCIFMGRSNKGQILYMFFSILNITLGIAILIMYNSLSENNLHKAPSLKN